MTIFRGMRRAAAEDQRFDLSLQGFPRFLVRRNDQHGVVARDRSGNFRKFCAIHRRSQRLRRPGGVFSTSIFSAGRMSDKNSPSARANDPRAIRFFRQRRFAPVTFMRLDQPKLLQVARQGRLRHAQLLRGETAAQFFLVRDARIRDDPKDLPVPKCFAAIHRKMRLYTLLNFYTSRCSRAAVNANRRLGQLMQDSHQCPHMHWILPAE